MHTDIPQHQAELVNIECASYLKIVQSPNAGNDLDEKVQNASISLSIKGGRNLKTTKVGICLKIQVGDELTE